MKEYRLSSPEERLAGISFSVVMVIVFGILLFTVRGNLTMLITCTLAVLLITVLLGFYVLSVLKAACVLDPKAKTMEVKGFPTYTVDLSGAVLLQTLPRRSGHTSVRCLVFSDTDDKIVAAVPTLFTYKQGVRAEPLAMEIAKELGIEFKENVPVWEYDKEEMKKHLAEENEKEKAASRAKRQAFLDKLWGRTDKK